MSSQEVPYSRPELFYSQQVLPVFQQPPPYLASLPPSLHSGHRSVYATVLHLCKNTLCQETKRKSKFLQLASHLLPFLLPASLLCPFPTTSSFLPPFLKLLSLKPLGVWNQYWNYILQLTPRPHQWGDTIVPSSDLRTLLLLWCTPQVDFRTRMTNFSF